MSDDKQYKSPVKLFCRFCKGSVSAIGFGRHRRICETKQPWEREFYRRKRVWPKPGQEKSNA